MLRKPLSLRAQAVAWLAQRDHSELELRRKLAGRFQAAAGVAEPIDQQIDAVIAWLRERGYLDDARFVDSRVHLRSERFGVARIQQELSQHGVAMPAEVALALRASELERATDLWGRKFGEPATDLRAAARQARFLAGRGFSSEVVRQVLREAGRGPNEDCGGN